MDEYVLVPARRPNEPVALVGLNHLTVPFCIVCLLVSEVSSERSATASLRTAPQPGFWEDPKRMRPIGAQRPERPKSELWGQEIRKCGLSKASGSHCRAVPRLRTIRGHGQTRSWPSGYGEERFPQFKSLELTAASIRRRLARALQRANGFDHVFI